MITQKELMELYDYNPLTGELNRKGRLYSKPSKHTDNSNGYHVMMIKRKRYYAHRLVWLWLYGEWPAAGLVVDHIDNNRLNNRPDNLRLLTRTENLQRGHQVKANRLQLSCHNN